jgi:DNA-binding GntR family transcriptional regulator
LAKQLDVSPTTVSRALAVLAASGAAIQATEVGTSIVLV